MKETHTTPAWEVVDGKLVTSYQCSSFEKALSFVVAVGKVADAEHHHPDIDIRYDTVLFALCTHDEGNAITEKDHRLAQQIDRVFSMYSKL